MKYDKLVRDKIPEITRKNCKIPITHFAGEKEYYEKLKEKLREEIDEFLQDNSIEELADLLEIIFSICDFKKVKHSELEKMRKEKAKKRGAFKKRIILDETKPWQKS